MRYRFDPPYPSSGRRPSPPDSRLRASDAERSEVADKLSRHFADGRLDQAEFKQRLDRAMGATTRGDLQGLFDDLPRLETEPPPPTRRRRFVPVAVLFLVMAVALVSVASAVHAAHAAPWLLVAAVALVLWHRADRHHHPHRPASVGVADPRDDAA